MTNRIKSDCLFRTLLVVASLMCVSFVQATSAVTDLEQINRIAGTGAMELAIRILEQEQPAAEKQPDQWMVWERQRIAFYRERKDWQRIAARLQKLPKKVDADFIIWARTERANALIQLRQGVRARQELRELIWKLNLDGQSAKRINHWRRLIIESYLVDGRTGDAEVASLRLQQDVGTQEMNDILVRARIAILNNRIDEANRLLKPYSKNMEATSLMLLAQLRGSTRSAKSIRREAIRYLQDKSVRDDLKVNLWAVVAVASQKEGQPGSRANALEHVLVNKQNLTLTESIFTVDNDTLWNAYQDYALDISNNEQLLIGEDQKWLDVSKRIRNKKPVGARAMSAFVMLRSQSSESRKQAAELFVEMLGKRKSGNRLLVELFQVSRHFPETGKIPGPAKHALVDIALTNSDIDRASELMATIEEPPEGSDKFMWWLRRARILVLGNQVEVGARALHDLLDKSRELQSDQIDKLLQVVFDLQTAGKHELAFGLFEKVLQRSKDEKVQREVYYWMADSRKAQERYADAAVLYLKSAMHPDPENMDPWAQTAHFQAAESLAKAGMYDDATTLFKFLLRVTEDPTRRATLKRELQRLWAMQ